MANNGLMPVNPVERRTADQVQQTANEVISLALTQLRKADVVHAIANQVIEVMHQEMREYRLATEANGLLAEALSGLNRAEELIRARGETK